MVTTVCFTVSCRDSTNSGNAHLDSQVNTALMTGKWKRQKLYPSHLTENMGSKANATLKEPSFIQQFLVLPSVLLLTHSIISHVIPPNPELSFPLNLQKLKK